MHACNFATQVGGVAPLENYSDLESNDTKEEECFLFWHMMQQQCSKKHFYAIEAMIHDDQWQGRGSFCIYSKTSNLINYKENCAAYFIMSDTTLNWDLIFICSNAFIKKKKCDWIFINWREIAGWLIMVTVQVVFKTLAW